MRQDDLVASAAYQPEPTAVAAARRFVRETLQAWVMTGTVADGHGLVDDAVLLTSELVTNAVVHAGTAVQVTCKLVDGAVEVVISDDHPGRIVAESGGSQHTPLERTSGRGLLLPAALASAWGVTYGQAAKAVWFRLGPAGPVIAVSGGAGRDRDASMAGAFGIALEEAAALASVPAAGTHSGPDARAGGEHDASGAPPGEPGYRALLATTLESARAAVGADAVLALMADEDGDLRVRAVAGIMPPGADGPGHGGGVLTGEGTASAVRLAPAVVTVPFLVDGRVTGLLTAVSAVAGAFSDSDAGRLQQFADAWGALLQHAWLGELDRLRRMRMSALTDARALLTGTLGQDEVMALAGRVAVPRLAPWCAVLLWSRDAGLRTAYARHMDTSRTDALTRLLDRMCQTVAAETPPWHRMGDGLGRRVPLAGPAAGGAAAGAENAAWVFPLRMPAGGAADGSADGHGLFAIGEQDRMPREIATLTADLACRVGAALSAPPSKR